MTQQEFIAILFNDTGFHTTKQRKDFLQKRFKKSFSDELTIGEASICITILKEMKNNAVKSIIEED